jgi:hypothetical protein
MSYLKSIKNFDITPITKDCFGFGFAIAKEEQNALLVIGKYAFRIDWDLIPEQETKKQEQNEVKKESE